jgi:cytochrome b6-f complex iron-sulfur subunit
MAQSEIPSGPSRDSPLTARRGFFHVLARYAWRLGWLTLTATGIVWLGGMVRFFLHIPPERPVRFKAGRPEEYRSGEAHDRHKERHGVWIVCRELAGQRCFYALRTTCTHLGCITVWHPRERQFRCPCHGSSFSLEGINLAGPAPRPLERCAIRLAEDGQLEIDTGRLFHHERGQWDNPASYVLV